MESLNRGETQEYIRAQIDSAGGCGVDLFSEDACQSVFKATDGVPRLINQLCDHALLTAYVAGRRIVEPAQIEEAWADLQQLPTPWNSDVQHEQGGVIEFGPINDSPDESSKQTAAEDSSFPPLRVANDFDEIEADLSEVCHQIERIEETPAEAEDDFQPAVTIQPEIELVFSDAVHPFKEEFEEEEVVTDRYAVLVAAAKPLLQAQTAEPPADGSTSSIIETIADQCDLEETLPPREQTAATTAESAQSPVLIIEDDEDSQEDKPRPISTPRHREYSRLFAKLLQG